MNPILHRFYFIKNNEITTINKNLFLDSIKICIEDSSYFRFDDKFYRQRTGLATIFGRFCPNRHNRGSRVMVEL